MSPESKAQILKKRAAMLHAVRLFFSERDVLELDCYALSEYATIDAHIDPIEVDVGGAMPYYLHTSPEYKMKRLLSMKIGDCYQLSHVFRKGEISARHHPEFTMIEWYRIGYTLDEMIQETLQLASLFLGKLQIKQLTYMQALQQFGNISSITKQNLCDALQKHQIDYDPIWSLEELLHLTWSEVIESKFDKDIFTVIIDFPPSECALAQIEDINGCKVAKRFEIYVKGLELANGYFELTDPIEQKARFEKQNAIRQSLNKKTYPIDPNFIAALEAGLPNCSGVAVGFDRLFMLQNNLKSLKEGFF